MKHTALADLDVSRIGLGTMGMSFGYTGAGSDDAESVRTIHRGLELGVTFLDTAEVYGPYANEELVGKALKGRRNEFVVPTKFGMISHASGGPGRLDSSPANKGRPMRTVTLPDGVEMPILGFGGFPKDRCRARRVVGRELAGDVEP